MTRVALTGGIGSGKSAVADLLRERGCVVIDADALAREAVAPGSAGLVEVVGEFGPEVLDSAGHLDRGALAALAFSSPDRRRALEGILHPRIAARRQELLREQPEDVIVFCEVPLLVETGGRSGWDAVIVVDCPDDIRLQRLVEGRGMALDDARRRMSAQASREERLAIADYVIDNSGSRSSLSDQVSDILRSIDAARGT